MARTLRNQSRVLVGSGLLLALLITAGILTVRSKDAAGRGAPWSVRAEHTAVVREELAPGRIGVSTSTGRIWFTPDAGWRMEIDSSGHHGERRRVFGVNNTTMWGYDPDTNRYTLTTNDMALLDPRASLAVMMATAGTQDFDAALAAIRSMPRLTVTTEGDDVVAGRPAKVVVTSPYRCTSTTQTSISGHTTPTEERCDGVIRSWLDAETGWMLKQEADDGRGNGHTWDTQSATFDATIDPALYRFDPPPGSAQVDKLD